MSVPAPESEMREGTSLPWMCGWTGSSSLYLYLTGREEMGRKSRESKPRGKKIAVGNLVRYWPWKDWAGEGKPSREIGGIGKRGMVIVKDKLLIPSPRHDSYPICN